MLLLLEWKEHAAAETVYIRPQLIQHGDSIWWSTDYPEGEQGMVQYDTKSDKIISVIKYPKNMKPSCHSCCKYKNEIYIVDGGNGEIISFNLNTKQFIKKIKITEIGGWARCIAMDDDEIHIFNGSNNNCKHLIYYIKQNKIKILNDSTTTSRIRHMCILKYQNKIIRFGGWNCDTDQGLDTFCLSSIIKRNQHNDIEWKHIASAKLIKPVRDCGCIIYKQYIIVFGGYLGGEWLDTIYVLNMESDSGWMELKHIKCPMKSAYVAVLSGNNNNNNNMVHLLTQYNKDKVNKHYSVSIWNILKKEDDVKSDEKVEENDVKIEECIMRNALVLLISISKYWNYSNGKWRNLPGTIKDKKSMMHLFVDKFDFKVIANDDDKIKNVKEFKGYLSRAQRELNKFENEKDKSLNTKYDAFFFIFAGHGIENNEIILSNGDAYKVEDIKKWFDGNEQNVPSMIKNAKIYITDCCRSKQGKYPQRIQEHIMNDKEEIRGNKRWHNPDKNTITIQGTTDGYAVSDQGYLNAAICHIFGNPKLVNRYDLAQLVQKTQQYVLNKTINLQCPEVTSTCAITIRMKHYYCVVCCRVQGDCLCSY